MLRDISDQTAQSRGTVLQAVQASASLSASKKATIAYMYVCLLSSIVLVLSNELGPQLGQQTKFCSCEFVVNSEHAQCRSCGGGAGLSESVLCFTVTA